MPYDIYGEYFEYPKGKRKLGLTQRIRRCLAEYFRSVADDANFTVRLKGWGEKRGHLLYEIAWEITTYTNIPDEFPTEKQVRLLLDSEGSWGCDSNIVFDLQPTRKPPTEPNGIWAFMVEEASGEQ